MNHLRVNLSSLFLIKKFIYSQARPCTINIEYIQSKAFSNAFKHQRKWTPVFDTVTPYYKQQTGRQPVRSSHPENYTEFPRISLNRQWL